MSEQEKYDLTVKAADLIYRMFDGKKTTHSDILEKAGFIASAIHTASFTYVFHLSCGIFQ